MILSKWKFRWLFPAGGVILLLAGFLIVNPFHPQPVEIDMNSSPAAEIKQALTQVYVLEDTILCVPGTNIEILSTILIDTRDYQPTFQELKTIAQLYGLDGLTHAGLLTAKKAYYQLRMNPPETTPPPGLIPTQPPAIYCPKQPFQVDLSYKSIALEGAEMAIVKYSYLNGDYEATLRKINGHWMVAGIRLTRWYGNG
jgi:hypothetical protein